MGGYWDYGYHADVSLYDVDEDSWSDGPPLPHEVAYSSGVTVDGCVYSIGGHHEYDTDAQTALLRWCG